MKIRLVMSALLCALGFSSAAFATSMKQASLTDLVNLSQAAVVVEIAGPAAARWEGTRIFSQWPAEVVALWGGTVEGNALTLRTLGGIVDGIGQVVHGTPSFTPGKRYALFLAKDGEGYRVSGMVQGSFEVVENTDGVLVARRKSFPAVAAPDPLPDEMQLEALKQATQLAFTRKDTE